MIPAAYAQAEDIRRTTGRKRPALDMYVQAEPFTINALPAVQRRAAPTRRPQRTISAHAATPSMIAHGTPTAHIRRTRTFGMDIITSCVSCAQRLTSTSGVECIAVPLMRYGLAHIKGGIILNKGKTAILPIILIAVIVLAVGAVCIFTANISDDEEMSKSVFDYASPDEVRHNGYNLSVRNSFLLDGIKEFGYQGDAEIRVSDEKITAISFTSNLIEGDSFDGEKAKEETEKFVLAYSEKLEMPFIEEPTTVQFTNTEEFEKRSQDSYVALAEQCVLLEYSYRDAEGVLWITQIYSPVDGTLTALFTKYLDDSAFEGFEPQVNMKE